MTQHATDLPPSISLLLFLTSSTVIYAAWLKSIMLHFNMTKGIYFLALKGLHIITRGSAPGLKRS
jgi:hypothetical protein